MKIISFSNLKLKKKLKKKQQQQPFYCQRDDGCLAALQALRTFIYYMWYACFFSFFFRCCYGLFSPLFFIAFATLFQLWWLVVNVVTCIEEADGSYIISASSWSELTMGLCGSLETILFFVKEFQRDILSENYSEWAVRKDGILFGLWFHQIKRWFNHIFLTVGGWW